MILSVEPVILSLDLSLAPPALLFDADADADDDDDEGDDDDVVVVAVV